MRAVEAHYRELAELREFFVTWWGRGWETWLVNSGQVNRGQISDTLARRIVMSSRILPRLRLVRELLEAGVPRDGIAKPPRINAQQQREFVTVAHIQETSMHE